MSAIDALQNLQRKLIRKATDGSVFLAPSTAAAVNEGNLFHPTTGDLVASGLPTGYTDLGLTTDAGAQFGRSITTSEVSSWQSKTPSRIDVTADSTTLQVACQETKAATIAMAIGVDLSGLSPNSGNGVLRIDTPETASQKYYRALSIAADESDLGEIVIARFLPNASPTNFDGQNFGKSGDPILWGVTFTAYKDDVLGTASSYIFGGAGWKALLASMGLSTVAAVPVISSVSPLPLAAAGGTVFRVMGSGFNGLTALTVAGNAVASGNRTTVSDNEIIAVAPAHAAGTGLPIVATNATGPSTTGATLISYA